MDNDEASPITKTPVDKEYEYGTSRRSSTSLSLVGVGGTPTDLRHMNVYERSVNSPISPAVHPRCRTTTDFTTTERATQCTTTQCPQPQMRTECTPMCTISPPCQQCSPPRMQRSPPCMSVSPQCTTRTPEFTSRATQCTQSTQITQRTHCPTRPTCSTRSPQHSTRSPQCTARSPQCTTRSPQCTTRSPQCTTRSPQCTTRSPQCTARATQCQSPMCPTRSPQCTTRSPSCPTRSPQCTARTTYVSTRSPCSRAAPQCTRASPPCTRSPPQCQRTTPECKRAVPECIRPSPTCTPRSPTCTTTTTQCTPRSECPYSPGVQSLDSQKGACPMNTCRKTSSHAGGSCSTAKEEKGCALEICKIRAGLNKSPTASICTSPQSSHSNTSTTTNTKRLPFPTKKTEDESSGGVVRWTEKCAQRCKRPTWNANRWNCDKPVARGCAGCPGAHPIPSRCAQDYDTQRFGTMDGIKPRKCDCCDRRYNQPALSSTQQTQYQRVDRRPPPVSSCGCDGFSRGINHIRRPPPMMPQNPFDSNASAYFNRLNKGMPFPPPNQPPPFNSLPPPGPFNPQFHPPAPPPPPPPPPPPGPNVANRDNSLNVMQDTDEFPSPLKSCTSHCHNDQDSLLELSPNQNVNMVTNPHLFNNVFLPRNSNHNTSMGYHHNYMGYGHPRE